MRRVVVDASYMMAFLLVDEKVDQKIDEEIKAGKLKIFTPPIFETELFNGILMAHRRERVTWRECHHLYTTYQRLMVTQERVEINEVFELAKESGLTVYDASYVWLARKMKVELLTYDKKMQAAAGG